MRFKLKVILAVVLSFVLGVEATAIVATEVCESQYKKLQGQLAAQRNAETERLRALDLLVLPPCRPDQVGMLGFLRSDNMEVLERIECCPSDLRWHRRER